MGGAYHKYLKMKSPNDAPLLYRAWLFFDGREGMVKGKKGQGLGAVGEEKGWA